MRWWVLWRKHYIYANSRNTLRSNASRITSAIPRVRASPLEGSDCDVCLGEEWSPLEGSDCDACLGEEWSPLEATWWWSRITSWGGIDRRSKPLGGRWWFHSSLLSVHISFFRHFDILGAYIGSIQSIF